MSIETRKWNVVAFLAVFCVVVYLCTVSAAWLLEKITFDQYTGALLPMLTGVVGYLAKMLENRVNGGA